MRYLEKLLEKRQNSRTTFLKKGKIFKVIISDNIGIIKTFSMRVRILKLNSGNAYFNNDNHNNHNNHSKKCVSEVYGFCTVCM